MVVIHVGAVNLASHARRSHPVQLAVGSDPLQQRKRSERRTINREHEGEPPRLEVAKKYLARQKAKHRVRAIQQRAGNRVVAIGGAAGCKLNNNQDGESCHRKEQRVPLDFHLAINPLLGEPEQYQQSGAGFEGENRPGFDGSERDWPEHEQAEGAPEQDGSQAGRPQASVGLLDDGCSHENDCFPDGLGLTLLLLLLVLLLLEAKVVDPELTTDRTAHRNAADVQNYELAIRVG